MLQGLLFVVYYYRTQAYEYSKELLLTRRIQFCAEHLFSAKRFTHKSANITVINLDVQCSKIYLQGSQDGSDGYQQKIESFCGMILIAVSCISTKRSFFIYWLVGH